MENQLTRTTYLSRFTDSKQHRCRRSMLRLATFVILFLCSMTISWAQGTTTGSNSKVTLNDATSPTIKLNREETTTTQFRSPSQRLLKRRKEHISKLIITSRGQMTILKMKIIPTDRG